MSNNQLPADMQERIKADAERHFPCTVDLPFHKKVVTSQRIGYIAGAMVEAGCKQKMIEDVEGVIKHAIGNNESVYVNVLIDQLKQLVQQWKERKEVGNG